MKGGIKMKLLFEQGLESIREEMGYLSPSRILDEILRAPYIYNRDYTYIILGKSGPTGKTWIWNELRCNGLRAVELSENTYNLVEYADSDNHCIIDDFQNTIIIILNRPLK